MNDVKCETPSEQKLREIAQALLFLVSARAVMEEQVQNNAPPSLLLLVAYIRTYAWLVDQIIGLFKSNSCEKVNADGA